MKTKLVSVGLIGVAALFVRADEGLPPCPDDTPPCYVLVNMDSCARLAMNKNHNNCPQSGSRLAISWVDCPFTRNANSGENGRDTSVLLTPNVDCVYKSGGPNQGGGCTWNTQNPPLAIAVTCYTVTGGTCTGPNCQNVN